MIDALLTPRPAADVEGAAPVGADRAPAARRPVRDAAHAVVVIAHRDVLRQLKHPGMLVTQMIQVLFFVLVYAVGFAGMIEDVGGVPFAAFAFPGILAIQVVTIGVTSGLTYAWDRQFGVLREMQIAPVPRVCLPVGKAVATVVVITCQSAVVLAAAPILGVRLTPGSFVLTLAVCAGVALVFSVLGLLLALAVRRIETLQATVQLAMYPLLFLSGSVFSRDDSPGWLGGAMQGNPTTYAVDLVRRTVLAPMGGTTGALPLGLDLAVLGGGLVLLGAAVAWRVRW